MSKYKQSKPQYPKYTANDEVYTANTQFVKDSRDNSISRAQISQQLASAPRPRETGMSGYPHKFHNEPVQIEQLAISRRTSPPGSLVSGVSSTTSHYEYPVFGDSHAFDWHTKKRNTSGSGPEHLRAITNQNGRFKGVVAHQGTDGRPSGGPLEWVPVRAPSKGNNTGKR